MIFMGPFQLEIVYDSANSCQALYYKVTRLAAEDAADSAVFPDTSKAFDNSSI